MRGRIRTIKPEAFTDEDLWDLEDKTGLPIFRAFTGLWCYADREGRFEWKPRVLKTGVLPYWNGSMEDVMLALADAGFLVRYSVEGRDYGAIRTFSKHQVVNPRETKSQLPGPGDDFAPPGAVRNQTRSTGIVPSPTRDSRAGFVYVATYPGAPTFKVGFSKRNPIDRVGDLSAGSPEPLVVVEFIDGSIDVETQIHRALAGHRHHREWFHANDSSVEILHAWFTRDPRVIVAHVGKGTGRELEGEGNWNDASRDANVDPPSQVQPQAQPTRPDNPIPTRPARAHGVAPEPRKDITTTLRPSEWSPSPEGVAYAQELGLTESAIETTITELRNWKGTRAFTVDWWDAKWVTFVENRAQWLKEPKPRKARTPTEDGSEMAKAREAMAFLRGDEPVRAEVV